MPSVPLLPLPQSKPRRNNNPWKANMESFHIVQHFGDWNWSQYFERSQLCEAELLSIDKKHVACYGIPLKNET